MVFRKSGHRLYFDFRVQNNIIRKRVSIFESKIYTNIEILLLFIFDQSYGHKLKTEISKEEIESTLNVMGMTKGDDLDDIELVV